MEIKFNNTQLKELQRILELIEEKFGGIIQCNDNDEIFALTNCNGFETVQIP